MTSRFYYVTYRDLRIVDRSKFRNTNNLNCDLCKNKVNQFCNCVYMSGDLDMPDNLSVRGQLVKGANIKREEYYDKIVGDIVKWINVKE